MGRKSLVRECPKCQSDRYAYRIDGDYRNGRYRRRRHCRKCDTRWTTYEITEEELSKLTKRAGMAYRSRDNLYSHILNNDQVQELVSMKRGGVKISDIAEYFGIHNNTVSNIYNRYIRLTRSKGSANVK